MDLTDDIALARPPAFPLSLRRLPRELVHQLLDNLPLVKVLQILSHKHEHLTSCVETHLQFRHLASNPAALEQIVDLFILYREIKRFTRQPLAPYNCILALGVNQLRVAENTATKLDVIRTYLTNTINYAMPVRGSLDWTMLDRATLNSSPMPNEPAEIRWKWTKESKIALNREKARQLLFSADLLSQYPEKLMIKKSLDPDQDGPRRNIKHIENGIRLRAKKILGDSNILHLNRSSCREGVENIALVPYDCYLWLFLEVLEKHPPSMELDLAPENKLEQVLNKLPGRKEKTPEMDGVPFDYPRDIANSIQIVLEGLQFVFTGTEWISVPRIQWDSWAVYPSKERKARFTSRWVIHSIALPEQLHRCSVSKIMPHDDREYVWLQTFLKVVTWMEDRFGYEKVKENTTQRGQDVMMDMDDT